MPQIYMGDLVGQRVYRFLPEEKRFKKNGQPRNAPRLGKVHQAIFAPDGLTVVGFSVRRPDVAGVVKRDDEFLALDGFCLEEDGLHIVDDAYATGEAARVRLGLDWDECLIWEGMDVRTVSGKVLGRVADVRFDSASGAVSFIRVSAGGLSDQLVGLIELPSGLLKGYHAGYMVVDDRVEELGFTGGLAGKAGEMKVRAAEAASDLGAKASEAASELGAKAAEAGKEGIHKAAKALGKQLSRTKGMFADFKREFDEASK